MNQGGVVGSTKKSAMSLAQAMAKQMAQEPMEILRSATSQVTGVEKPNSQEPGMDTSTSSPPSDNSALKEKMKASDTRTIEALNREIADMQKQKAIDDLVRRISSGEVFSLEGYTWLTQDQKQTLNAQMQAVKARAQMQNSGVVEPAAKKGRRLMGFSQKAQAQKQQTRVEKPVPPSG